MIPDDETQNAAVDAFNQAVGSGALVRYWTGAREGEGRLGRTYTPALRLGGTTPVVYIRHETSALNIGAVALTHVQPLSVEDAEQALADEEARLQHNREEMNRRQEALHAFREEWSWLSRIVERHVNAMLDEIGTEAGKRTATDGDVSAALTRLGESDIEEWWVNYCADVVDEHTLDERKLIPEGTL